MAIAGSYEVRRVTGRLSVVAGRESFEPFAIWQLSGIQQGTIISEAMYGRQAEREEGGRLDGRVEAARCATPQHPPECAGHCILLP